MGMAALITWILTALGGFFMLAKWISGGAHRDPSRTRLSPPLIFGHLLLAAGGLLLWIIYLVTANAPTGWVAFIVLVPVALLGFTMLARWIPTYRASRAVTGGGNPSEAATVEVAERSFPVAVVVGHGLLAVVTVLLVLLALASGS